MIPCFIFMAFERDIMTRMGYNTSLDGPMRSMKCVNVAPGWDGVYESKGKKENSMISSICHHGPFFNNGLLRCSRHSAPLGVVGSQITGNKMYSLLTYFCCDNRSTGNVYRMIGYDKPHSINELAAWRRTWHGTCY